jgi:hypothetical protein
MLQGLEKQGGERQVVIVARSTRLKGYQCWNVQTLIRDPPYTCAYVADLAALITQ